MSRTYFCHRQSLTGDCTPETPPNERRYYDYDTCNPDRAQWFQDDAFAWSDYSGGPFARANRKSLNEEYGALDGVAFWHDSGSHGSHWTWFAIELESDDCREEWLALKATLDALDDYPIIDDQEVSSLESDEECEAWTSYGAGDFCAALAQAYPHHGRDFYRAVSDAALYTAWVALCTSGETCIHESGGASFTFDHYIGKRAGACKPTYDVVRSALRDAIFEHTRRSKCHRAMPMTGPQDCFVCCKCGGMTAGWERGETVTPE